MSICVYLVLLFQLATGSVPVDPVARLRAKVLVEAVSTADPAKLAGKYANPSKELVRLIGGTLDGDELYLFPDKTYLYCEWGDVFPLAITDKGTWTVADSILSLKSDPDVKWTITNERSYAMVHRLSRPREILLIGLDRELRFVEESANQSSESTLVIAAKERDDVIEAAKAARLKAKLMKNLWRPDRFTNQ